jgi:hypothetical protein
MVRRAIEEVGRFTSISEAWGWIARHSRAWFQRAETVVMLSVANSSRRAAASRRSWLEHAERAAVRENT